MKQYIGLDISSDSATIAILTEDATTAQTGKLQKPSELRHYLCPETAIAAEWTGALAAKWLDEALKYTKHVYIYRTQGIRADKRVVGNHQKTDVNDANAIARILRIQHELGSPRFYRYKDLQEAYRLRRIVYEAERYTREIARAKSILQNARLTGYTLPEENGYLKTLQAIEKEAWQRAEEAIKASETVRPIYETIKRLYPNSHHTACKIAVCIAPIERWKNARALKRYAGLYDQRGYTGKMVLRNQGRQGNKVLRTALVQLATPAKFPQNRWNPLYQKLKQRGLKGTQITIRIATYMLVEIYREAKREIEASANPFEGFRSGPPEKLPCVYCKKPTDYAEAAPLIDGNIACLDCFRKVNYEEYCESIREVWLEEVGDPDEEESVRGTATHSPNHSS